MAESPLPIRLAHTIGLTTVAAMAGASFSLSAFLVPRLLESPSPLLLKQWKSVFLQSRASFPPLSVLCTSILLYAAYRAKDAPNAMQHQWKIYLVSGLLTISAIPYTLIIMEPADRKLLEKAEATSSLAVDDKIVEMGLGGETAHQLVDKWATLNMGRVVMLFTSALLSTWTTLEQGYPH